MVEPEIPESSPILQVLNNDLLLEQILSNITVFSERKTTELISQKFYSASRRAPWRTKPEQYEILKIEEDAVHFGGQSFHCDSGKSIDTLRNLLVVKNDVKIVHLKLIQISDEILEFLRNFPNFRNLILEETTFSKDVKEFYDFGLDKLALCGLILEPKIYSFLHSNLQNLEIIPLDLKDTSKLLEIFKEKSIFLENFAIELKYCEFMAPSKELVSSLSRKTRFLNLSFKMFDSTENDNQLWLLARQIDCWKNIKHLKISTNNLRSSRTDIDWSAIFDKLSLLDNLETLSVSGIYEPTLFYFLGKGLRDLRNLKCLEISMREICKIKVTTEYTTGLFANLPLSIENLKLDRTIWNSKTVQIFAARFSKTLKSLIISNPRTTLAGQLFDYFIRNFENLHEFHYEKPIDSSFTENIFNSNLKHLRFLISHGYSENLDSELRNFFDKVEIECDDVNIIKIDGRKL